MEYSICMYTTNFTSILTNINTRILQFGGGRGLTMQKQRLFQHQQISATKPPKQYTHEMVNKTCGVHLCGLAYPTIYNPTFTIHIIVATCLRL